MDLDSNSSALPLGRHPQSAVSLASTDPIDKSAADRVTPLSDSGSWSPAPRCAARAAASLRLMPPKKKPANLYPPLADQRVDGWKFRVRGSDGLVTVGTHQSGPWSRWTFYLST
eukprot:7372093-Prymnesium_polylepis.1